MDSYTDCTYNKYNMNNENKHSNRMTIENIMKESLIPFNYPNIIRKH